MFKRIRFLVSAQAGGALIDSSSRHCEIGVSTSGECLNSDSTAALYLTRPMREILACTHLFGACFSGGDFRAAGTVMGCLDDTVVRVASVATSKNTRVSHVSAYADLTTEGYVVSGI